MANGVVVTGFEHGLGTIVVSGGGLASAVVGTGMSVQSTVKKTGGYALKGVGTGGETYITTGLPATLQDTFAHSFYFLWHTLPNVEISILRVQTSAGSTARINFDPADQKIFGRFVSNGSKVNLVLQADTWYRIDLKADVSTGTSKLWYNVEGVGEQYTEYTQAATVFNGFRLGLIESTPTISQGECYWDDVIHSYTIGDYPIGPHGVDGLRPNGDGTHNNASNIMEDSAGNDIDGINFYAYDKLDDNPWVSTANADYVRQTANGTSNYCEVLFENISQTNILSATAFLQYASAGTLSNSGGCIIIDEDNTETVLWGIVGALADYSENTAFYKRVALPTPAGGWDQAAVNALKCRFGYSGDANPDPYWLALIIEVAYTIQVTIPLDTAAISSTGIVLSIQEGGVTKSLNVASIISSGVNLIVDAPFPPLSINLLEASILATGVILIVQAPSGAIQIQLSIASCISSGIILNIIEGTVTKLLNVANLILTGVNLDVLLYQISRPISDTILGSWTDQDGGVTNIYLSIDEDIPSDIDYVKSPNLPLANTYKFKLENVDNPGIDVHHGLSIRARKPNDVGSLRLTVRLLEGSTLIATRQTLVGLSWVTFGFDFTEAEVGNITDYSNLYVELEATEV